MRMFRITFDFFTHYDEHKMTENKFMNRFIFLESIASCPGTAVLDFYKVLMASELCS